MKSGVKTYPFWRPDFTQNPFSLPAKGVQSLVQGMPQNQTPLRESRMTDVPVIMRPNIKQDLVNVPQGDKMQQGVAGPDYLLARLNAGIEKQKAGTK